MAADVPDLGTKIIVITDDVRAKGNAVAKQLGMELYALRGTTRPEFLSPEAALDRAMARADGPAVVADVWDNPGGGVPGDSTIILRELLARNVEGRLWPRSGTRLPSAPVSQQASSQRFVCVLAPRCRLLQASPSMPM